MALEVVGLKRKFTFDGDALPDPDINLSLEEVQGFYSIKHPELTTATISGPVIKDGVAEYEFETKLGTKG